MTTVGDALADFSGASLKTTHSHLLGAPGDAHSGDQLIQSESTAKTNILIVLPVFTDSGLGVYGKALLAARAPELLVAGQLNITDSTGAMGQIHLFDLSSSSSSSSSSQISDAWRMNVLVIGQGKSDDVRDKGFCGFVGSALDSGLRGRYDHIVIAVADFTGGPVNGQMIGAVARCRLAFSIIEDHSELVVRRMTLIVHPDQLASLCRGIEIAGPLCSSCSHPSGGRLNLIRQ